MYSGKVVRFANTTPLPVLKTNHSLPDTSLDTIVEPSFGNELVWIREITGIVHQAPGGNRNKSLISTIAGGVPLRGKIFLRSWRLPGGRLAQFLVLQPDGYGELCQIPSGNGHTLINHPGEVRNCCNRSAINIRLSAECAAYTPRQTVPNIAILQRKIQSKCKSDSCGIRAGNPTVRGILDGHTRKYRHSTPTLRMKAYLPCQDL